MSKEELDKTTTETNEDDLDDLDDLLDDFNVDILNKPPGSTVTEPKETPKDKKVIEPINDELNNLQDLIKDLNIQDPETKGQFEELLKNLKEEGSNETAKDPKDFDNIMKDTMERLKSSGKNIDEQIKNDQNAANPEDMLTQLLSGLGGGEGGNMDMSKLLVDMLEQLSSKEVLYEPIKDLNTKFPDYLKEKKGSIPEDQHANYTKQYHITNEIILLFESSTYNDEDKEQREKVNTLLESLQELGQPPSDLVGDASDFPGFGGAGLGGMGGAGDMNFSDKDLPKDFEKELEEGCKQQ